MEDRSLLRNWLAIVVVTIPLAASSSGNNAAFASDKKGTAVFFLATFLSEATDGAGVVSQEVWADVLPTHSITRAGMRASVSEARVRKGSLAFRYTLRRVEEYAPYYFKWNALLVVSFYDDKKKLVSAKHFNRFDIDRQFANAEKKWMSSSVTLDLPAKAKFYRVELMGYRLKSELIVLPDPDVR
jgi:hypothetical protein